MALDNEYSGASLRSTGTMTIFCYFIPQVGCAEGKPDRGGASVAGSCAHDDRDPAEIRSVASDRLHQGKERDTLGARVRRKETKFCWSKLLGSGVFRIDRRTGRSHDTRIHQEPGAGRQSPRAIEPLALTGHLQVAY